MPSSFHKYQFRKQTIIPAPCSLPFQCVIINNEPQCCFAFHSFKVRTKAAFPSSVHLINFMERQFRCQNNHLGFRLYLLVFQSSHFCEIGMITPSLSPYFAGAFYYMQPSEQAMTFPKQEEETTGYPNRKSDPLNCIYFWPTMKSSEETLAQVAQRSCECSNLRILYSQVGWDLQQPGQVEGVPANGRF